MAAGAYIFLAYIYRIWVIRAPRSLSQSLQDFIFRLRQYVKRLIFKHCGVLEEVIWDFLTRA